MFISIQKKIVFLLKSTALLTIQLKDRNSYVLQISQNRLVSMSYWILQCIVALLILKQCCGFVYVRNSIVVVSGCRLVNTLKLSSWLENVLKMLFDFRVEGQELLWFSAFTKQIDINVSVDIAMHCSCVALKKMLWLYICQKQQCSCFWFTQLHFWLSGWRTGMVLFSRFHKKDWYFWSFILNLH